jgi:serine/threonine protein kinase
VARDPLDPILVELARAPDVAVEDVDRRRIGERFGRFQLLGLIGRGSFGVVYEARDLDLGRHVAVKVMTAATPSAEALAAFRAEATTVARLNHPNIVTLHELGSHGETAFLVLELLTGETLEERLDRGVSLDDAIEIMVNVARGSRTRTARASSTAISSRATCFSPRTVG